MKLSLVGCIIVASTLRALAVFTVTNNLDSGAGSLRQAILNANASGGGTIVFANVSGTIALHSSLPAFTQAITVSGPGAASLTIQGTNAPVLTNSPGNTAGIGGLTFAMGTQSFLWSAIENFGSLTLTNCAITGGRSVNFSAGIYNSGSLTAGNCVFWGCRADDGAAAIWNSGTMNLNGCSLTNNRGNGSGCCMFNNGGMTLDNCTVAGNSYTISGNGGGIYNETNGTLVARNCSFTNNQSISGGGIWNAGSLAVTNCAIALNRATYSGGPNPGGGIYNDGAATLVNTTISGNSAVDLGGGILNEGTLSLVNCTIVSNTVYYDTGPQAGGGAWNSGTINSKNSIIAGNSALLGPDVYGPVNSQGYNLIQNTGGCTNSGVATGNLSGVSPALAPLRNNGGATWSHALLTGSPAIDAGTTAGAPNADQCGVSRPQGMSADIGAVEFQYIVPRFVGGAVQSKTNFWLELCCVPGTNYTLEASTNLLNWITVTNFAAGTNGVWQFLDTRASTYPRRFYHLKTS